MNNMFLSFMNKQTTENVAPMGLDFSLQDSVTILSPQWGSFKRKTNMGFSKPVPTQKAIMLFNEPCFAMHNETKQ